MTIFLDYPLGRMDHPPVIQVGHNNEQPKTDPNFQHLSNVRDSLMEACFDCCAATGPLGIRLRRRAGNSTETTFPKT